MLKNFRNSCVLALPISVALFASNIVLASTNLTPELNAGHIDTVAADPFPVTPKLKERAVFWRNVYAAWDLNQVAIHDFDHPGIVYKVITLPGEVRESFTESQRELVEQEREALTARLRTISALGGDHASLSAEDAQLVLQIVEVAGIEAVNNAHLRVRSQRGLRERFKRGLEISGRYDEIFRRIFREQGLPEDLAFLPHVESSFQSHARSSAGALGIWQFTRPTGRMFMRVDNTIDERLDPIASARASARYLRKAYDLLGNWSLAVTSYNHGMAGMQRAKEAMGTDFDRILSDYQSKTFGFASKNFYAEFLAAREVAKNPHLYFPEGINSDPAHALNSIVLDKPVRIKNLASRYKVNLAQIAQINPAWINHKHGNAMLPVGLEVWLPEKTKGDGIKQAHQTDKATSIANAEHESETPKKSNTQRYHKVRSKDTLFSVSRQYGIALADLRRMNNLSSRQNLLRVGQKLRIDDDSNSKSIVKRVVEKAAHSIHVVRKGDNLFLIAASYGVSVAEVLAVNRLTHASIIYPGQRFRIPHR